MSHVSYNSKRLIPAPLVTVTKNYNSSEDGTKIGSEWQITINGTFVSWMGSPNSSGVFWTLGGFPPDEVIDSDSMLASVIRKGEALRQLFSTDGQQLEFQSEDGSQPMKCNPKVTSLILNEGTWFDRLVYTITLTAPVLSVNGVPLGEDTFPQFIESANENWQIETNEEPESINLPRTYRLSHTISAKGKRFYDSAGNLNSTAWEQARQWVVPKLGLDSSIMTSSGVTDLPSYYGGYNHLRNETIDKYAGNYAVTETWVLASGSALETFDISTSNSADNALTTVNIDGTITGLELRSPDMQLVTTKYINANDKWTNVSGAILSRAQTYSDTTLNVSPLSSQLTRSPAAGIIRYNYTYDTRPSNIINGARYETVTISDNLPTDFIVPVFVLGRTQGPVLQDLKTSKERTRALNIEAVMPIPSGSVYDMINGNPRLNPTSSGTVEALIAAAKPIGTTVGIQDRQETWDIKNGRYTYNTTWIWEL